MFLPHSSSTFSTWPRPSNARVASRRRARRSAASPSCCRRCPVLLIHHTRCLRFGSTPPTARWRHKRFAELEGRLVRESSGCRGRKCYQPDLWQRGVVQALERCARQLAPLCPIPPAGPGRRRPTLQCGQTRPLRAERAVLCSCAAIQAAETVRLLTIVARQEVRWSSP